MWQHRMPALGPLHVAPSTSPATHTRIRGLVPGTGRVRSGASVPCACVEGMSLCGGSWLPVTSFIFSCWFALTVFTGSAESEYLPSGFREPTAEGIFTAPMLCM